MTQIDTNEHTATPHPQRLSPKVLVWTLATMLQALCVLFFIGDVVADLLYLGLIHHTILEAAVTCALILGVGLGIHQIRSLSQRADTAERQLANAKSAFSAMVGQRFAAWRLTEVEREVALLTLKGFDISEISALRGTAKGTVRAQLANLYEKSGTHSRGEFVSSFLDALVDSQPEHERAAPSVP